MQGDFTQITWDAETQSQWRQLVRLALAEDLDQHGDLTSQALVEEDRQGEAAIVSRQAGVLAGLVGVPLLLEEVDARLRWRALAEDGQPVGPGQPVGQIQGAARAILACERILLNLLGRLSGIASLARQYVEAVAGTGTAIYDTRKTTPGWRRLEKYAVHCGGARNHRTGLFDAVLIKDNHLALSQGRFSLDQAVRRARQYLAQIGLPEAIVEIEVDRLDQLEEVLPAGPDVILLDNMSLEELRTAVARRNALNPHVVLEASGGVRLETVRAIAQTGVDRISVGALTHSAQSLDLGLDWIE